MTDVRAAGPKTKSVDTAANVNAFSAGSAPPEEDDGGDSQRQLASKSGGRTQANPWRSPRLEVLTPHPPAARSARLPALAAQFAFGAIEPVLQRQSGDRADGDAILRRQALDSPDAGRLEAQCHRFPPMQHSPSLDRRVGLTRGSQDCTPAGVDQSLARAHTADTGCRGCCVARCL